VRTANGDARADLDEPGHEVTTRTIVAVLALATAQPAPPIAPLLDRASAYVDRFEHDFAQVIGDEDYRQRVSGAMYRRAETRRTQAEMLFLWMPAPRDWLTVRNVRSVDGQPIPDSEHRLTSAMADTTEPPLAQLRRLRDESARFNIGRTFRNINYPTMALHVLEEKYRPRFRFTVERREKVDGVETWRIAYDEQQAPTLIQNEHGESLYAHGRLWTSAVDGTILRTTLEVTIPWSGTTMSTDVDFRRDAKLAMRVPGRMRETIVQHADRRPTVVTERIQCTATYSNYRRFETFGRIVP